MLLGRRERSMEGSDVVNLLIFLALVVHFIFLVAASLTLKRR